MAVWTQKEIQRFAHRVQRLVDNSPERAVLLAPGQHMPAFKVKNFQTLDPLLKGIYCRVAIPERAERDQDDKRKIYLMLFGNNGQALWRLVKAWAHEIQVEARRETESYKNDEDSVLIKAFNDGVIEEVVAVRRRARKALEENFQISLSPVKR